MKQLAIIIFGLFLYTVHCKPPSQIDDYVYDEIQNDDNYEVYQEQEEIVSEESNAPKLEQPVVIVTKGQKFTRHLNESVELPCVITGDDYVRVWRRHGAVLYQGKIGMGAKRNMNLTADGSLTISNLDESDSGDYECMAMISEINKPTIKHTLDLLTPPIVESLTTEDGSTVLKSGDTLILHCKARGNPEPVISWHKGSERLPFQGPTLTVPNVKHHDAGEYRCLVDNKIGQPVFKHIHISIEHKPVISIDQISVSSEDELDTELKCTVHAEPKPQVVWKKDGVNIKNGPRTVLTNNKNVHILLIKKIEMDDFGVYTCSAVNSIGSTNKNVTLVKTPAVVRFIKPRNDTKDVVLTWEVQSKSHISEHELQYRKKGNSDWHVITPEVSTDAKNEFYTVKYVLKGLEPGVYETRIRSLNRHGWSEYSEIMPFEGVYAKHGHHKSHKKGHKDHKEAKGTQTVKSLDIEEPAEHQENDTIKHASIGASEISAASTPSLSLAWISVALIVILQLRTPTSRL